MRVENLDRLSEPKVNINNIYYLHLKYLFRDVQEAIKKYAKKDILDIGCGNKPYLTYFSDVDSYIGCDIAQSNKQCVDIICEATNIPLEDKSFDTVFTTQTLEHVFDHRKMLSEANRLLKKDGIIIITCPMYWPHHEEPYDFFRFTKYGLEELLKISGFEILEIKANGGKFSVLGLVILETLNFARWGPIKWTINLTCYWLDNLTKRYRSTSNFIAVGQKK